MSILNTKFIQQLEKVVEEPDFNETIVAKYMSSLALTDEIIMSTQSNYNFIIQQFQIICQTTCKCHSERINKIFELLKDNFINQYGYNNQDTLGSDYVSVIKYICDFDKSNKDNIDVIERISDMLCLMASDKKQIYQIIDKYKTLMDSNYAFSSPYESEKKDLSIKDMFINDMVTKENNIIDVKPGEDPFLIKEKEKLHNCEKGFALVDLD
jgi:hypothetical protein